ncbi:MAG: hypothetical protein ACOCX4_06460, partial [Planctomycetota bacterium]
SLSVDTTWRWEMMRAPDTPSQYRRFWGNVVRHLAPDPRLQPDRPRIHRDRSNAAVGETVSFAVELVNETYRPVREADLAVTVVKPSGATYAVYPRDGRGHPGRYPYDVTLDEPGVWTVRAAHGKFEGEETVRAGDSMDELEDPRARPERMAELADATAGAAFGPQDADALLEALRLRTRVVAEERAIALWNLPLTLILFLACVCLDCLLRKRRGMV